MDNNTILIIAMIAIAVIIFFYFFNCKVTCSKGNRQHFSNSDKCVNCFRAAQQCCKNCQNGDAHCTANCNYQQHQCMGPNSPDCTPACG